MQITKLILENFSSYENRYEIDFTAEKAKPIILIGGQNGAGKTSIFTAIKLALYGPLAYGYSGINSFYTKKVRSLINSNAFQSKTLVSGVTVEFSVINDREEVSYSISRHWRTADEKLVEDYTVIKNGKQLKDPDIYYFENYLHTIIPPELFDFFLFDGEEIGNIFAAENYNKYVKSALLTLCGIDVFSVIQNFCKSFVGKTNDEDSSEKAQAYEELVGKIDDLISQQESNEEKLTELQVEAEQLVADIAQKEQEYARAGGISPEERNRIEKEINDIDKKREDYTQSIKNFFENQMPFFMLRDFFGIIKKQIDYEEKLDIHDYVKYNVTFEFIRDILSEYTIESEAASQAVFEELLRKIHPGDGFSEDILLGLSRDETGRIESLIDVVKSINPKKLLGILKKKNVLTQKYIAAQKLLRESLSEEDAELFRKDIDNAKARLESVNLQIDTISQAQAALSSQIEILKTERDKQYQAIKESAQNKHIFELNSGISRIMDSIITSKTEMLRVALAEKTVKNLRKIYRKNNLVSFMTVNNDFKFDLYQNQTFTFAELKSLLKNIGFNEFVKLIGETSVQKLYAELGIDSSNALKDYIERSDDSDRAFKLYKKIELNSLSKGERQIFILALYWAMIQISGKKIPFIIDTPYARIDAKHRKEISEKFFPNISDQVVILSTDEEITEEYYRIIKPFISKEYLLKNNKKENRTTICEGYFFRVD